MKENYAENTPQVHDVLKKIFGFESFRPNQKEIIENILGKKDVFAVMPTGGGKSLCYQLPARIMSGVAVVISPLISLMKDQVDAAVENGIEAAFINSSLTPGETSSVFRRLRNNLLDLIYIAPERFAMPNFLETLKTLPVSLFAIDEAHCISEWGHDFRPDYLSLSNITGNFPDTPVAAFTATATQKVQCDIINKLGLRSPFTVRASFNRHNLFYRVESKRDIETQLLEYLRKHADESGIIYRTTRDAVDNLAGFLNDNGVRSLPYHAGLTQEERKAHQEAFNKDEINVMVATIAFGMGIDKSNVRFVVHADLPKNLEGYYQETGRAGRDGEPADCVLFFGRGDIPKIKYFIEQTPDEQERAAAQTKLDRMVRYASHNVCRRRQLLEYFGDESIDTNCGGCDVCTGKFDETDVTIDAQKLMSAISRTGQRFGIKHIIDIVTGAGTKRIRDLAHDRIKTYGAGRDRDKNYWHFITDELLARDMLYQDGDRYPVLRLTEKGKSVLFGNEKIIALVKDKLHAEAAGGFREYDAILFEKLRSLRKDLADQQGVPPYIIFSDRTLHDMCRYYPASLFDMCRISGVGSVKLKRYGDAFVCVIKKYLEENPGVSPAPKSSAVQCRSQRSAPGRITGETIEKTFELFAGGHSIDEISKARNLAASTITGHIEQLITEGRDIDIDRLIDPLRKDKIEKLFLTLQSWQLKPVIEHFRGEVSYNEAKLVRVYLQRKSGHQSIDGQILKDK